MPTGLNKEEFESLGMIDGGGKYTDEESKLNRDLRHPVMQDQPLQQHLPSSVDISNFTYPHTSSNGGNHYLPFQT